MNTIGKKRTFFRKAPTLGWVAAGLLGLAGLLLLAGGWKSEPTVAGIVRLEGQPLAHGSIKFVPASTKGPVAGATIKAGNYHIVKGLRVGEYRVEIHGPGPTPKMVQDPEAPGRLVPKEVEAVDQNSKLTCVVNAGANAIDFEVEGFKGKPARGK
jgi:hypothetical protein